MATFTSTATGNWNLGATWGNAGNNTPGVGYPDVNDTAIITGFIVTVTTTQGVTNVTVGSGGTLIVGSHIINISGNWDSSLGTFTIGTSTINLTGTGSLKTPANSSGDFYNLSCAATGNTTTLQSNIYIGNIITLNTGIFAGSSYNLALNASNTTPLVNNGATYTSNRIYYHGKNITIAGGTYTLTGSSMELYPGTISTTYTLGGNLTIIGSNAYIWQFVYPPGTSTFNTANYSITAAGLWFGDSASDGGTGNCTFNAGSSVITLGSKGMVPAGDGTSTHQLNLNSCIFNCGGPWETKIVGTGTNVINVNAGNSTVILTGTTSLQLQSGNSVALNPFYNLTLNGSGGTYTLQGNLFITGIYTVIAGTLVQNGFTTQIFNPSMFTGMD